MRHCTLTLHWLCVLLCLLPTLCYSAEYTVDRVINGKSFVVSSGETVRLAAIEAPNAQEESTPTHRGRSGEPLGEEARHALELLIAHKTITLELNSQAHDRHDRLLGQAYVGNLWVQGELLTQGYAMTYSFSDTPREITQKMLAQERLARAAKRGLWAHPYYRVITPGETDEFINRFKLVKGTVVSVHHSHDNIYINFFNEWKGKFAVFISRKHAPAFTQMNLTSLERKTILVRGWIHYHNAPMMDITHPDELEIE